MRLRKTVTHVVHDESDSGLEEVEAWQPGHVTTDSEAEEIAKPRQRLPAGGASAAPVRLAHGDLTQALLALPATHETPAVLDASECTAEWARSGGLSQPALVRGGTACADLGIRLPADLCDDAKALLPQLLAGLPLDTPVPVIDVATQEEHAPLPLADFLTYFCGERGDRLLNVVSLSLAGTPLESRLCAPQVVREVDLVARAWPAGRHDKPEVQLYALASPAGCVTDWHMDFGGSSVWYALLAGAKVFALAPPTRHNLRAFAQWASSSRQTREALGGALQDVHKYTVRAGEVLLIPGGWPHAVVTPEDSVVVGGNYGHAANLGLQCLTWRIEDALHVQPSYRYPSFRALCWYAARTLCASLPPAAGEAAAVERAAQKGAKRLFVKLRAEGEDDALHPAREEGHGCLEDDAKGHGPPSLDVAADLPPKLSALLGMEAALPACEEPLAAEPSEQRANAALNEAELSVQLPLLLPVEMVESAKLIAQLKHWLKQSRDIPEAAGVPSDLGPPRPLLARLQVRLRAAGIPVPTVAQAYAEEVEEVTTNGARSHIRVRANADIEPLVEGLLDVPLPGEESDPEPKRAKKAAVPRAPPKVVSVRDRLKKRLGMGMRR